MKYARTDLKQSWTPREPVQRHTCTHSLEQSMPRHATARALLLLLCCYSDAVRGARCSIETHRSLARSLAPIDAKMSAKVRACVWCLFANTHTLIIAASWPLCPSHYDILVHARALKQGGRSIGQSIHPSQSIGACILLLDLRLLGAQGARARLSGGGGWRERSFGHVRAQPGLAWRPARRSLPAYRRTNEL